jgi:hypothetical protein
MGDVDGIDQQDRIATLTSDYLARRRMWSSLLRELPDYLRGAPLFFAGTSNSGEVVCDFVNELLAVGQTIPRRFIFLADDATANNPKLCALVRDSCVIQQVRCSLSEFCEAVSPPRLSTAASTQRSSAAAPYDAARLLSVEDQISFVPTPIPRVSLRENKHRLLEPCNQELATTVTSSAPNWAPTSLSAAATLGNRTMQVSISTSPSQCLGR